MLSDVNRVPKGKHEKNHGEQTTEIIALLTVVLEMLKALLDLFNELEKR